MPAYGTPGYPRQLVTGIPFFFFAQEVPPVPPANSVACCNNGAGKSLYAPMLFVVDYSVPALNSSIIIQGAMFDIDAKYQVLQTLQGTTEDFYTDFGLFAFYRVSLSSFTSTVPAAPGVLNVTVIRK